MVYIMPELINLVAQCNANNLRDELSEAIWNALGSLSILMYQKISS